MTARFVVADVFDGLAQLEDGSIDLVVTSPPFLALRSYLPADHPDKGKEIGSEATPAEFLDVLLRVTAELRRVLAPHGSIAVELGDTYAGSGGAGGDYRPGGWREGQPQADGSEKYARAQPGEGFTRGVWNMNDKVQGGGAGWPLAKSVCMIPELYRIALAYGRNPLRAPLSARELLTWFERIVEDMRAGGFEPSGAELMRMMTDYLVQYEEVGPYREYEPWLVRNKVTWCRPNPPVGALGDKWRPATSDVVIACVSSKRYWDDLATRNQNSDTSLSRRSSSAKTRITSNPSHGWEAHVTGEGIQPNPAGAPLLDYWVIPPGGYNGQVATEWKRPVDRRESVGDIGRTTSADCPEHGGQSDSAPTGSHDGQVSADQSDHNPGTGARPESVQLPGFGPNDATPDLTDSAQPPKTGKSDPEYSPAATRRSKASNKTVRVPATSPLGTPSEETTPRTDDKSGSPESGGHHPDTSENSISEVESVGNPASQMSDRIADTDTELESFEACTCSYYVIETQYTSHYAVFPPELVVPLVKAMCPEKVCRTCGEPARRIVERHRVNGADDSTRLKNHSVSNPSSGFSDPAPEVGWEYDRQTTGWTDCGHDDFRPGLVLDPFAGSGTTLSVATGHGHDAIGIDLDERNAELALDRVGPLMMEVG